MTDKGRVVVLEEGAFDCLPNNDKWTCRGSKNKSIPNSYSQIVYQNGDVTKVSLDTAAADIVDLITGYIPQLVYLVDGSNVYFNQGDEFPMLTNKKMCNGFDSATPLKKPAEKKYYSDWFAEEGEGHIVAVFKYESYRILTKASLFDKVLYDLKGNLKGENSKLITVVIGLENQDNQKDGEKNDEKGDPPWCGPTSMDSGKWKHLYCEWDDVFLSLVNTKLDEEDAAQKIRRLVLSGDHKVLKVKEEIAEALPVFEQADGSRITTRVFSKKPHAYMVLSKQLMQYFCVKTAGQWNCTPETDATLAQMYARTTSFDIYDSTNLRFNGKPVRSIYFRTREGDSNDATMTRFHRFNKLLWDNLTVEDKKINLTPATVKEKIYWGNYDWSAQYIGQCYNSPVVNTNPFAITFKVGDDGKIQDILDDGIAGALDDIGENAKVPYYIVDAAYFTNESGHAFSFVIHPATGVVLIYDPNGRPGPLGMKWYEVGSSAPITGNSIENTLQLGSVWKKKDTCETYITVSSSVPTELESEEVKKASPGVLIFLDTPWKPNGLNSFEECIQVGSDYFQPIDLKTVIDMQQTFTPQEFKILNLPKNLDPKDYIESNGKYYRPNGKVILVFHEFYKRYKHLPIIKHIDLANVKYLAGDDIRMGDDISIIDIRGGICAALNAWVATMLTLNPEITPEMFESFIRLRENKWAKLKHYQGFDDGTTKISQILEELLSPLKTDSSVRMKYFDKDKNTLTALPTENSCKLKFIYPAPEIYDLYNYALDCRDELNRKKATSNTVAKMLPDLLWEVNNKDIKYREFYDLKEKEKAAKAHSTQKKVDKDMSMIFTNWFEVQVFMFMQYMTELKMSLFDHPISRLRYKDQTLTPIIERNKRVIKMMRVNGDKTCSGPAYSTTDVKEHLKNMTAIWMQYPPKPEPNANPKCIFKSLNETNHIDDKSISVQMEAQRTIQYTGGNVSVDYCPVGMGKNKYAVGGYDMVKAQIQADPLYRWTFKIQVTDKDKTLPEVNSLNPFVHGIQMGTELGATPSADNLELGGAIKKKTLRMFKMSSSNAK